MRSLDGEQLCARAFESSASEREGEHFMVRDERRFKVNAKFNSNIRLCTVHRESLYRLQKSANAPTEQWLARWNR